jgi:hypothetical protein
MKRHGMVAARIEKQMTDPSFAARLSHKFAVLVDRSEGQKTDPKPMRISAPVAVR